MDLTPENLSEQAIDFNGAWFHVHKAFDLNGEEWSLVGYWMPDNKTPEIPVITHLMIPKELIKLV